MTDREKLYSGMSAAAWSYLFLYFNVNLGRVNILPQFVGYWLLLSAIRDLKEERRDLALLRPLGILLLVWHPANWVLTIGGRTLSGLFPPLELIIGVAALYFHFQLFTDCAALAAEYQPPEETLDRSLLRGRTVQAVLMTAMTLLSYLSEWFGEAWQWVQTGMAVIYVIAGFCLMMSLFRLRKLFESDSPISFQPPEQSSEN